jgi:hypothetical protein
MLVACTALVAFGACGDDSGSDAGVGAGAGGAGAGGVGGAAGAKAGTGGAGGALSCGGTMCPAVNTILKSINQNVKQCCTATTMKCGQTNVTGMCFENASVGKPDTSCPAITVSFTLNGMMMTIPQAGCCVTATNKCGGDFGMVGWGCIAREALQSDMGGPLAAMACGGGDGGNADAGL